MVIHPAATLSRLVHQLTRIWRPAMPADRARLAEARAILAQLGVTVVDLQCDARVPVRAPVPTLRKHLPQVMAAGIDDLLTRCQNDELRGAADELGHLVRNERPLTAP